MKDYFEQDNNTIAEEKLFAIYNLQFNNLKTFIANTYFNINTQDQSNGDTLLLLSIQNENYILASYLLDSKANPNCKNKYDKTPLHYAIEVNNHKLINLLLENNANPNIKDKNGDTPMHKAAYKGDLKVIRLLLLYKADTKVKNNKLLYPIDCSRENCHYKCVNILSETIANKSDINNISSIESRHKRIRSCLTFPSNQPTECNSIKEDSALTSGRNHDSNTKENRSKRFDSDTKNGDLVFEDNNIAESMISHSQEKNVFPWYCTEKGIAINLEDSNQINIISPYIDIEQFTSFGNYKEIEAKEVFSEEGSIFCKIESMNNKIQEIDIDKDREMMYRRLTTSIRKDNVLNYSMTRKGYKISSFEEIDFCISIQSNNKRNTISHKSKNRFEINDEKEEDNDNDNNDHDDSGNEVEEMEDDNSIIDNTFENDDYNANINNYKSEDYLSNDIIESYQTEEEESTFKHTKTSTSEVSLENILKIIGMQMYIPLLIKEGFDDIFVILNQMKHGYGITDKQLKEAGIMIPGHRARILIKLQEGNILHINKCLYIESKGFDFVFQSKSVYHYNQRKFEEGVHDYQVKAIESWLKVLKMEHYLKNFYEGSYHSIDLLLLQMVSWNPIDDDMLKNELAIDKLGYRARILNQLKEDSINYTLKLKRKNIEFIEYTNQQNMNQDSCKCIIY